MKLELGELLVQVASAAAGAAVSLRALPGASLAQRAGNLAAGFAIAVWGGAALVEHLNITSLRISCAVIFIVGATGLVAFDAIVEGVKRTDLAAWLASWLPGRKGG